MSLLSKRCQAWQLRVASWHPRDSEMGLRSLIPSCCGLCYGKDEHPSVFPVIFFVFFLWQCLHCVGLTAFMEQADELTSCGAPGLCLSATQYVVTFPLHAVPSCLWSSLLAPLGITTERAAVCQPPPEPSNWAAVNLLLEEFPTQQTWLSLTFIT